MSEWKRASSLIFDSSKQITLEQLEKHIKDTIDITDGANQNYIMLLKSLKDLATMWKIKAKTILKIRPNENMNSFQRKKVNQQNGKENDVSQVES